MLSYTAFAQELRCNVQIVSQQIQGTNKQVFQTLQNAIYEFMNNRVWTNHVYTMEERIECNLKTKDGEFVPVLKNATLLRDEDGTLLGIVETVTDLRPLRQLEQQVTQATAQRLQQVGRLVGGSRHRHE